MLLYDLTPSDRKPDASPEEWTNSYGSFSRPHYETKERYLEMAKEIYDWSAEKLGDMSTGMIVDIILDGSCPHPILDI